MEKMKLNDMFDAIMECNSVREAIRMSLALKVKEVLGFDCTKALKPSAFTDEKLDLKEFATMVTLTYCLDKAEKEGIKNINSPEFKLATMPAVKLITLFYKELKQSTEEAAVSMMQELGYETKKEKVEVDVSELEKILDKHKKDREGNA